VRLFGGFCSCCGERAAALAPPGLEPGSPFGKSIEAIAVYLHYGQAIGIQRLRLVFGELFGLSISEGAICNILVRDRDAGHGLGHGGVRRDLGACHEEDPLGVGLRNRRLRAAHHPP
jgi:transposase